MREILLTLIAVFVPFSFMSIGGGIAVLGGIQHEAVNVRHWVTAQEFIDLFAVSRAAPGPGTMVVTLIGWKVAGWAGAIIATLALFVPSSLLCYVVVRLTDSHRDHRWHRTAREGLAPVGVGLTIGALLALFRLTGAGAMTGAISIASAGLLLWVPRFPVLALLALGGVLTALVHQMGWM